MAEYRRDMIASRATETRHVFDQPEQRDVHFLEHGDAAPRIYQCDILRCRDDDRAVEPGLLSHGELRITGARGQVDNQNVEIAPCHLAEQLRDRRDYHRPAPDHGEVFLDHEADGHHLDAEALHRLQHPRADLPRFAAQTEQFGLGRTIDVGVEDAGFQPDGCEGQRKVTRDSGFTYTALAGGNSDDVLDAGNAGRPGGRTRFRFWIYRGHDAFLMIRADHPCSHRARANSPLTS